MSGGVQKFQPLNTTFADSRKFEVKAYKRGQIFFKFGLLFFTFVPLSVMYYKTYSKQMWNRGMIKDMERISNQGKSIHDIPRYKAGFEGEGSRGTLRI